MARNGALLALAMAAVHGALGRYRTFPSRSRPVLQKIVNMRCVNMNAQPPAALSNAEAEEGLKAMQQSLQKLNPEIVESGGLLVSDQPENGKDMFRDLLDGTYLMVEYEKFSNLRLLNVEPPVIRVPEFFDDKLMSSLLSSVDVGGKSERFELSVPDELQEQLQKKIKSIFPAFQGWSTEVAPGKLTLLGLDSPRLVVYPPGSSSERLEDALPLAEAFDKKYQRRAKLRVELTKEGTTYFNGLQLDISPAQGDLMVTFPSYKNSLPDSRIMYSDIAPTETRVVFETWVTARLERMKEMQKQSGTKFVSHPNVRQMQKMQSKEEKMKVREEEKRPSRRDMKKAKAKREVSGGFGS